MLGAPGTPHVIPPGYVPLLSSVLSYAVVMVAAMWMLASEKKISNENMISYSGGRIEEAETPNLPWSTRGRGKGSDWVVFLVPENLGTPGPPVVFPSVDTIALGRYSYHMEHSKILHDAITFDDVLLIPARSDFVPADAECAAGSPAKSN